jgi:MSHA pilin protein MshC
MRVADSNRSTLRRRRLTAPFSSRRQIGVTLVELAAVVVITGILAAVAVPRMFDNRVFQERGYADEIASSVRYARRIAIASGCNVRFTVNAAGYAAAQPSTRCDTAGAWGVAVQSPDRRLISNATPAGVVVGAVLFEFRPTGELLNPVAPLNVGAFTVTVNAATGTVGVS